MLSEKHIIGVLLFKKMFDNEDTRIKYLLNNKFKTNFRKKKPQIRNNYYLYKQKDFIKYQRIEERILNNAVKYLVGYKK